MIKTSSDQIVVKALALQKTPKALFIAEACI
jgi:hypothetical protein